MKPPCIRGPLHQGVEGCDGSFIKAIDGHSLGINALALTRDDRYLVSASNDATLKVWDFENGRELMTLAGHGGPVTAVVITPDGQHAVSAAHFSGSRAEDYEPHDNPLIVWSLKTGKIVTFLHGHMHSVMTLAMTPDGQRVISGEGRSAGEENLEAYTLRFWNLSEGTKSLSSHVFHDPIETMKISPCGQYIVAAITDTYTPRNLETNDLSSTITILELASGAEIASLKADDCHSVSSLFRAFWGIPPCIQLPRAQMVRPL